ncbi:hypothetical protein NG726_41780, partial [Pseudomonas sp. MOB-449]|nr:hypothetical protein [Pseudomonas sp. MOB-449]
SELCSIKKTCKNAFCQGKTDDLLKCLISSVNSEFDAVLNLASRWQLFFKLSSGESLQLKLKKKKKIYTHTVM